MPGDFSFIPSFFLTTALLAIILPSHYGREIKYIDQRHTTEKRLSRFQPPGLFFIGFVFIPISQPKEAKLHNSELFGEMLRYPK